MNSWWFLSFIENMFQSWFSYLYFYLSFSTLLYIWELYLDIRLLRKLNKAMRKLESRESTDKKSIDYSIDKLKFGMISGLFSHLVLNIVLYYHGLYFMWSSSGKVMDMYIPITDPWHKEVFQSIIFITITMITNILLQLPFSFYRTFHIEAKYGFNQITIGIYFMDMLKGLFLFVIIGWPLISLFLYVILWTGESFVIYIWIFMMLVQLLAVTLYPTLIQPLFNKVTELDTSSSLYSSIENLASKVSFPLKRIHVIDGSKRSNHSNAYFYGFFNNKHIVLFDTLIQQCKKDEIVAILGHELGHWYYNHTFKSFLTGLIHLYVFFYIFSHWIGHEQLYTDFGFPTTARDLFFDQRFSTKISAGYPIFIGFVLFQFLYSPIESVLGFLMNIQSRKFEFEADAFASKHLELASDLTSGLEKIQEKNLGNNHPDWLHSAYHHSHPPVAERISAIKKMI